MDRTYERIGKSLILTEATWERALIRRLCMTPLDSRLGGITTETAQSYDKEVAVVFTVNGCVLVSPPFAAALPS